MRKTIGKYRLLRRLGTGGFSHVYKALDTIEGVHVALKLPNPGVQTPEMLEDFRKEIRLAARLDHPNILPVKNAEFYDGRLVVAYPLGEETLADRIRRRLSLATCLQFAGQMLGALAYAHQRRVIHCDVKPENLILFPGPRLRLTDFGIARVALRTLNASGSGTVGYVAPEQAMGKPSFRSDVFAAGLVIYRMLAGTLPEWPYEWPLPGLAVLRRKVPPAFVAFLRRALQVDHRKRFASAEPMLAAYRKLLPAARRFRAGKRRRPRGPAPRPGWPELRRKEFLKRHRGAFRLGARCGRCAGPVAEAMQACPWCGTPRRRHRTGTTFPATCSRCGRGRKLDWRFCAWCHGAGFRKVSDRTYSDVRYTARCASCRGQLMPFMRYCPWCRTKVRRPWQVAGNRDRCPRCDWGVFPAYWDHCPWCAKVLGRKR
ncbi:MAG: protein kinase domain-containing protein [Planctomycetota bacterium]